MFGRKYFAMRFHHPFKYAATNIIQLNILRFMYSARQQGNSVIPSGINNQVLPKMDKFIEDECPAQKTQWQKSCNNDYWVNRSSRPAAVSSNGGLRGSTATRRRR